MNGKFELMKHQRYALACMSAQPHLGIFYEAGTGKTAIALSWLIKAFREGRIDDALIICPASLRGNWASSMDKMAKFEGVSEEDVKMLKERTRIVSFRKTWACAKTAHKHRDGAVYEKKAYSLDPAVDKPWGAIFIDEAHSIGNHSSAQTKACMTLARLSRYRFIMTGTPVSGSSKAGGKDWQKLFGQVNFLEPGRWRTWSAFCSECVTNTDRWFKPSSYNQQRCEDIIQEYGIFARLEDCVDMPGFTDTVIPCELAEKKVYKDVTELCIAEYNIDPKVGSAKFGKLLQVCSGFLLDDDKKVLGLRTAKDEALADILDGTDDKVVVFCNFTASVDRCAETCRKAGRRVAVFDGRSRGETWRDFQEGSADVIVIQYQAGGAGLDLFASHTMVLYEPCMSALNMTQARARIYRKGQTRGCRYIRFATCGTTEEKVWNSVLNGVDVTADMLAAFSISS